MARCTFAFFLLAIGCGGGRDATDGRDAGVRRDAGGDPDAGAPPFVCEAPDPRTGQVAVSVFDFAGPVVGADLIAHDAAGAIVGTTVSDADGRATLAVPAGGMITSARSFADEDASWFELATIQAVEPGDCLVFGDPRRFAPAAGDDLANARVVLPGPFAGGAEHSIAAGDFCAASVADPARPEGLAIVSECVPRGATTFPLLARVADADQALLAFGFIDAVPLADPVATIPAWRTDLDALDLGLANLPPATTRIAWAAVPRRDRIRFLDSFGERAIDGETTFEISTPLVRDFADDTSLTVEVEVGESMLSIVEIVPADPPPVAIDVAALPAIVADASIRVAAGVATASWFRSGASDAADLRSIEATSDRASWAIHGPPGGEPTVRFPALPEALAEARFRTDDVVETEVRLVDRSDVDGYAAIRAGTSIDTLDQSLFDPFPLGVRLVVSSWPR